MCPYPTRLAPQRQCRAGGFVCCSFAYFGILMGHRCTQKNTPFYSGHRCISSGRRLVGLRLLWNLYFVFLGNSYHHKMMFCRFSLFILFSRFLSLLGKFHYNQTIMNKDCYYFFSVNLQGSRYYCHLQLECLMKSNLLSQSFLAGFFFIFMAVCLAQLQHNLIFLYTISSCFHQIVYTKLQDLHYQLFNFFLNFFLIDYRKM